MNRILCFVGFLTILLFLDWGCTKEINLISNVDYSVAVAHENTGFVGDKISTALVLTSERGEHPGLSYYVRYKVSKGEGYFEDENGAVVPADTAVELELEDAFSVTWNYVGTSVGTHSVTLFTNDSFEKSQMHPLQYALQNLDIVWEANASQLQTKVGDTLPINLNLINNHPEREVGFVYQAAVRQGVGRFLDSQNNAIVAESDQAITAGTSLVYVVPETVGVMQLVFELTDSNGQRLATSLDIEVLEETENITPIAVAQLEAGQLDKGEAPFEVGFVGDTSNDPDGRIVSYLWQFMDDGATTTTTNPTYVFATPGTYQVQLTVTDNEAAQNENTDTNVLTIIVEETMHPDFNAVADTATTEQDNPVTILVLDNDEIAAGITASVSTFTQALNGTVTADGTGALVYTAQEDFVGNDQFTYTITDGDQLSSTTKVVITVTKTNAVPIAVADNAETDENSAISIAVLANDSDTDNTLLNIATTTDPTNGSIMLNTNGTITYTPNQGYFGSDTFTYTITDAIDESAPATVTILINDINQPPIAVDDTASTTDLEPIEISILDNDTDEENDPLTITAATALNGAVVVNMDNGSVAYTPKVGFVGTDQINYTITDGITGNEDEGVVAITLIKAPFIEIPGEIFEWQLVNDGIDSDGVVNGRALREDVEKVTKMYLGCEIDDPTAPSQSPHNISGIEYFVNLNFLSIEACENIINVNLGSLINLESLFLHYEVGTEINVSKNTNLTSLDLFGIINENIDLSKNLNLKSVAFNDCLSLKAVNLSIPSNDLRVQIARNPNLTCIQVSDIEAASNNPNWKVEDKSLYSLDCGF